MKNVLKIVAVAAVAVALTQTVQAIPAYITGNIAISGAATLNTASVNTATQVTSWGVNTVVSDSGAFPIALVGNTVTMTSSTWSFASGALPSFWSVGGFTFNLLNSYV